MKPMDPHQRHTSKTFPERRRLKVRADPIVVALKASIRPLSAMPDHTEMAPTCLHCTVPLHRTEQLGSDDD